MVRALNIVLLKLASEAPSGPVICSLVHVLLRCTGAGTNVITNGSGHSGLSEGGESMSVSDPLPSTSTKPASRLLLRVLAEESRRPQPFTFPGKQHDIIDDRYRRFHILFLFINALSFYQF